MSEGELYAGRAWTVPAECKTHPQHKYSFADYAGVLGPLETRRAFSCDIESALQRQSYPGNCPLIEKASYQRYSMRHAPWRREFRQLVVRIGSPVTAGFSELHKSGAQRERGVA